MAVRTAKAEKLLKVQEAATPKRRKMLNTGKARISEAHRQVVDQYFAFGCVSKSRALRAAGYSENSSVQNVFGRDDVQDEIARRRRHIEKRRAMSEDDIISEFEKLARANVGDLMEVNEDGTAYIDYNGLTFEQKAAISEYQVESYSEKSPEGDGSAVTVKKSRVKFHSKQAALDSLARIKGLYKEKIEVSTTLAFADRIMEARRKLAGQATIEADPS